MQISKIQTNPTVYKKNNFKGNDNKFVPKTKAGKYIDRFVKNAAESTPVFLGMAAIWAFYDKSALNVNFKKAFSDNIKKFFMPMLVVSSAFLSYIDNRDEKKR